MSWITDLNCDALLGSRRNDLQLELTYETRAIANVRELVRREQECCAFLTFDLRWREGVLQLLISAPEDARAAAEILFEPFQSKEISLGASCGCKTRGAQ
jgi:hypothetical protein